MLFSGKIPFHVPAILGTPFATICHYSRLFAIIRTIRHYSHCSFIYLFHSLFVVRDYSLFTIQTIDCISIEKLSADSSPLGNLMFLKLTNMLVLRTSNFQGATIRPIVPRHKHSIVFIVHH